jgi:circadian clock protein KaiC
MSESERSISSLMDTWISLRDLETNGERNRILYLLKSRGMNHSKQVSEYQLHDRGIRLVDVYLGPDGVFTGSARLAQEARERERDVARQQAIGQRRRALLRKRSAVERQIQELQATIEAEEDDNAMLIAQEELREASLETDRAAMARKRGAGL